MKILCEFCRISINIFILGTCEIVVDELSTGRTWKNIRYLTKWTSLVPLHIEMEMTGSINCINNKHIKFATILPSNSSYN